MGDFDWDLLRYEHSLDDNKNQFFTAIDDAKALKDDYYPEQLRISPDFIPAEYSPKNIGPQTTPTNMDLAKLKALQDIKSYNISNDATRQQILNLLQSKQK